MKTVATIDLFAGPGGLSEGFSSLGNSEIQFNVGLSVEKDPVACRTLRLRKFFRRFEQTKYRDAYYAYVQGSGPHPSTLFPKKWNQVERDVLEWELGAKHLNQSDLEARVATTAQSADSWILIGGPPCQAYSLAGRSRMRGGDPRRFMQDHRHTLYVEYLRILAKFSPPLFVMENVKGLLSSRLGAGTAFDQIKRDLSDPHRALGGGTKTTYDILPIVRYEADGPSVQQLRPTDFVVRSERHGIPQARHRVILVGIRSDLQQKAPLRPLTISTRQVSLGMTIGDLPRLRSRLSREADSFETWKSVLRNAASQCRRSGLDIQKLRRLSASGRALDPDPGIGMQYLPVNAKPKALADWFHDPLLRGVLNHEARSHIRADLARYMFVAAFAEAHDRSPTLEEFPKGFLPNHRNVQERRNRDEYPFADRFRAQRADSPSTTITSHISRDGHYFIHPDVLQCRSLSVREAARLQTFPDNYFFEGNRTQQYHQVGNAVPPLLAKQIAESIADFLIASGEVKKSSRQRPGK